MSDTIPKIRVGDKVRIMQTDKMVRLGYANKTFQVHDIKPGKVAFGWLDDDGKPVHVKFNCLMKVGHDCS